MIEGFLIQRILTGYVAPNKCDLPRENRPSSHLVMIVEIPVLKFLIGITLVLGRLSLVELDTIVYWLSYSVA